MRIKPKVVPVYAIPEAGNRCHVKILDTYISKLPQEAFATTVSIFNQFPLFPRTRSPGLQLLQWAETSWELWLKTCVQLEFPACLKLVCQRNLFKKGPAIFRSRDYVNMSVLQKNNNVQCAKCLPPTKIKLSELHQKLKWHHVHLLATKPCSQ